MLAPGQGARRQQFAERHDLRARAARYQLLLLSGIGPAAQLREVGLGVAVDLPGVGVTP
ncbi:hypothetical protein SBI_01623 [Streptomyces bingchenggensis BCW-1]|uniref:Uncharacterized protein n=1 Tax=Streptomyces bingchenggensis (strain BCW-1) TaxID=749414 RepID=D7CFK8_STRBB|nr:hypothetical protein SBI_01623 [Streptomyces bingchenggensis BCW-1]